MRPEFGLSPTVTSYKLRALEFISTYFAVRHESPSYGEIGAALGVTRMHAGRLVKQLAAEQRIHRLPGKRRSIIPLSAREEAVRILRKEGFVVDEDALRADPPVTNQALPPLGLLAHDPVRPKGTGDDRASQHELPRARRSDRPRAARGQARSTARVSRSAGGATG